MLESIKWFRKKNLLTGILVSFVSLAISLALAEIFVRCLFPHSRDYAVPSGLFQIDRDLGWRLSAEESGRHTSRYFEVDYQINNLGYRDRARKLSKADGVHRVLVTGDSQIFGWGVAIEDRFTNRIESKRKGLEIWNMGVPGYGLDQQVLSYKRDGESLNANEVLFFVSRSTLQRVHYSQLYKKPKPKFSLSDHGVLATEPISKIQSSWFSLAYIGLSRFYLPYFIEGRIARFKTQIQVKRASSQTAGDPADRPVVGELEKGILSFAKKLTEERNHQITILTDLKKKDLNLLKEYCRLKKIQLLVINQTAESSLPWRFGQYDGHWTPQAHEQISVQLAHQWDSLRGELAGDTSLQRIDN